MRFLRRGLGSPVSWAATAVFLAVMVLWTVVTPAFRSPDEPQHVNSVLRLADGDGWPQPAEAFMRPEVLRAKTLTGFSAVDGQRGNWIGGTLLPGVAPRIPEEDLQFFVPYSGRPVTPPEDRLPFAELELSPGVDPRMHGDQMTQHPPLYYAVNAAVVGATGSLTWPFDRTIVLMRLVSVAMVMWIPLMAFSVTRTLTGNRRLADVAAVLPLAVPQLAALGGSVQNDALVIFLGGLVAVLLAKVLRGDRSWWTLGAVGVTLGLGLLTKGSLLALVPVVGVAVVVGARRGLPLGWRPTVIRLVAVWAIAFAVGGWWWAVNILRYGTIQPSGVPVEHEPSVTSGVDTSSAVEFAGVFWAKITNTFWGTFGQLELPLPRPLVIVLTLVLLALVALGLRRRSTRLPLLVLLSVFVLTVALVFWQMYASHLRTGQYAGIQGRYLFGGLVPVFAAAAMGVGALVREGGRLERWLPAVLLLPVLLSAGFGLWVGFRGYYIDVGWTVGQAWERMTDWSPLPDSAVRVLAGGVVVLALVALAVAVRSALRRDGGSPPEEHDPTVEQESALTRVA
jgi:4-amino-4-deoxy-L-arabinose transferase-like glycosyltransferase